MIASSDKEYKQTKLIKQGRKKLDTKFEELARWVSSKYEVNVIDIQHNYMKHNKKARVAIHVEFHKEAMKFKEGNVWHGSYDSNIQREIAQQYLKINDIIKLPTGNKFFNKTRRPNINEVFVISSAFEPIAREEANGKITDADVSKLLEKYNSPEIWTISRAFGSATLFVLYESKKDTFEKSQTFKDIEDEYYNILKTKDEFEYWKRDIFRLSIDSKENFDQNYESNWYYYYK